MQNDTPKCGLIEQNEGNYIDNLLIDAYFWYVQNWQHDDYTHTHQRYQLTYVEQGYQYFHLNNKTYLVPQHHVIWIPSNTAHRISSEAKTVHLRVALFKTVPQSDFFQQVHVFSAPPVLKEMLLYASKWNQVVDENPDQALFIQAILRNLPEFCQENESLHIPVPTHSRLLAVCDYINTHFHSSCKTEDLAEIAQVSTRSLQRLFKQETGITLQKYTQLIRILKSIELRDTQQYTLSEIAHLVGYSSLSAFTLSYNTIMKSKPQKQK
ncbi:helix-turn-helix transcriptional regulator [Myroides sp. 1354]|uniref:AraC family transcriptional regulator n=1 Tax=unclassified Myroides TaxID=2642485 RepID=UPI00257694E4|nr:MULTISPECIES: AraC family transcriptional regulator [unclassified Myroides]MDM1046215.1 helix-turn-helix transcriptional regulator [Myroides sp. R163-1]MDM1057151.1 helix-turn-helix transcriptional regulator [Myroides sp. 1354]MDM1070346.1 helix-turn-helix transcriptional regulator [Myroides sp. 1372]